MPLRRYRSSRFCSMLTHNQMLPTRCANECRTTAKALLLKQAVTYLLILVSVCVRRSCKLRYISLHELAEWM